MLTDQDHIKLYEQLAAKVKLMRGLQKMREKQGNWFTQQDRNLINRITREVDNMLLLDEVGKKVYLKNN